ncbi:hypothetical protein K435DRAFT_797353 [Dendrothele bispora CBS 962.96]|uniref:Uncharacterized protein n=1 Tax=Dendrothele bispora (strain CBS 962.96) TaxID=1314807 RepID=A0A4S8M2N3_DENBC|nr:hypothetical protein K435DRAFT_797353 [Dendrothele bispora CBS 962.96]
MVSMEKYLELGGLGFTMRVALEMTFGSMSIVAMKPHKGYTMLGFIRNNIISTWSRKMHLTNLSNTDVITSLTFCLKNSIDAYVVGHPVVMPRNVYLFIAPVTLNRCPESGSTEVRWLANGRGYFWSFHPSGSNPLSTRVCNILELPNYRICVDPGEPYLFLDYQHEAVKYVQEIQGFDPLTQDYARARGLPLVEMISPLEKFHLNVLDSAEEDQEALDAWSDAEETLRIISDSESLYEEASSQLQTILFPIPSAEQKLNGTTPEVLGDSDIGNFEGDSSFKGDSDDSALQALGLNSSLGSALVVGCKPSSWLHAYLIQGNVKSWTGFVPNVFIWVGINKE